MPIEFGAGVEVRLEQPGMPTFRLPSPQAPGVKLVAVTGPAGSGAEALTPRVDALEETVDALDPQAYLHTQDAPSTIWLVSHPLSFVPAGIEVLDHMGVRHHPVIAWPSAGSIELRFNTPVRGTARLS